MKKFIRFSFAFLVCFLLIFSAAACGNNQNGEQENTTRQEKTTRDISAPENPSDEDGNQECPDCPECPECPDGNGPVIPRRPDFPKRHGARRLPHLRTYECDDDEHEAVPLPLESEEDETEDQGGCEDGKMCPYKRPHHKNHGEPKPIPDYEENP